MFTFLGDVHREQRRAESDVLQLLWDHISNCYARAADARRRAGQTADPERRSELLLMEESWKRLAQSYELSEQLERSLLTRSHHLDGRLDWQRVAAAPFDRILELAIIGVSGIDTFGIPCRRVLKGWIAAESGQALHVQPTHWREWTADTTRGTFRNPAARKPSVSSAAQVSLLPRRSGE